MCSSGAVLYQFRVVVIGDSSAGKSTLVTTYANGKYDPSLTTTIGVEFHNKIVEVEKGVNVRLQIWDTGGQERFKAVTQTYYRRSLGVLIVYDVTERSSFDSLVDWLHEALRYTHDVVFQLVACKCDFGTTKRKVDAEEGKAFADFHKINFIETSAKDLYNVDKVFETIAKTIYRKVEKGELKAQRIPVQSAVNICEPKKKSRSSCQTC